MSPSFCCGDANHKCIAIYAPTFQAPWRGSLLFAAFAAIAYEVAASASLRHIYMHSIYAFD
jgi:hypothetical protein